MSEWFATEYDWLVELAVKGEPSIREVVIVQASNEVSACMYAKWTRNVPSSWVVTAWERAD